MLPTTSSASLSVYPTSFVMYPNQPVALATGVTQSRNIEMLLGEVRRVYMARSHGWKHIKRKVKGLPMALTSEIHYDAAIDQVNLSGGDTGA